VPGVTSRFPGSQRPKIRNGVCAMAADRLRKATSSGSAPAEEGVRQGVHAVRRMLIASAKPGTTPDRTTAKIEMRRVGSDPATSGHRVGETEGAGGNTRAQRAGREVPRRVTGKTKRI